MSVLLIFLVFCVALGTQNNPETLATLGTQNIPETLATLGTQNKGRRQTKQKS
jgi:hypothetical protein